MSVLTPDEKWTRKRFPNQRAREAADRAIDALPNTESLQVHLDTWLAAYKAAGGQERS